MSENSIEFSLSNSEQRDSWLNSGHRTLNVDRRPIKEDGNNEKRSKDSNGKNKGNNEKTI